jgi:hypothetical protein
MWSINSTQLNNVVEEITDMLKAAPNYSIQRANFYRVPSFHVI